MFEELIYQASLDCKKQKSDLKFAVMKCLPEVKKRSRTTRNDRNQSPIKKEIENVINKDLVNLIEKPAMSSRQQSSVKARPSIAKQRVFDPTQMPVFKDPMLNCPVCDRKFGPKAASRHIKFCQEKVQQDEEQKKFLANQSQSSRQQPLDQNSIKQQKKFTMTRSKTMTSKQFELQIKYKKQPTAKIRDAKRPSNISESLNTSSKHQFNLPNAGSKTERGLNTDKQLKATKLTKAKTLRGLTTRPMTVRPFTTRDRKSNFNPPWLEKDFFKGAEESVLESIPNLSNLD